MQAIAAWPASPKARISRAASRRKRIRINLFIRSVVFFGTRRRRDLRRARIRMNIRFKVSRSRSDCRTSRRHGPLYSVLLHRHSYFGRFERRTAERIGHSIRRLRNRPHYKNNTSAAKYPIGNEKICSAAIYPDPDSCRPATRRTMPAGKPPPHAANRASPRPCTLPADGNEAQMRRKRRGFTADNRHIRPAPPKKRNGAEPRRIRLRLIRTPPDHFVSPIFSISAFVSGLWPRKAT